MSHLILRGNMYFFSSFVCLEEEFLRCQIAYTWFVDVVYIWTHDVRPGILHNFLPCIFVHYLYIYSLNSLSDVNEVSVDYYNSDIFIEFHRNLLKFSIVDYIIII